MGAVFGLGHSVRSVLRGCRIHDLVDTRTPAERIGGGPGGCSLIIARYNPNALGCGLAMYQVVAHCLARHLGRARERALVHAREAALVLRVLGVVFGSVDHIFVPGVRDTRVLS